MVYRKVKKAYFLFVKFSIFLLHFFLIISALVIGGCSDDRKPQSELTYQQAYNNLLILGVNVTVEFDSFENLSVNGQLESVPCVKISNYIFFAVTETPKSIDNTIKAVNALKVSIIKEVNSADQEFCVTEGFTFEDILTELEDCKEVIANGGSCF